MKYLVGSLHLDEALAFTLSSDRYISLDPAISHRCLGSLNTSGLGLGQLQLGIRIECDSRERDMGYRLTFRTRTMNGGFRLILPKLGIEMQSNSSKFGCQSNRQRCKNASLIVYLVYTIPEETRIRSTSHLLNQQDPPPAKVETKMAQKSLLHQQNACSSPRPNVVVENEA